MLGLRLPVCRVLGSLLAFSAATINCTCFCGTNSPVIWNLLYRLLIVIRILLLQRKFVYLARVYCILFLSVVCSYAFWGEIGGAQTLCLRRPPTVSSPVLLHPLAWVSQVLWKERHLTYHVNDMSGILRKPWHAQAGAFNDWKAYITLSSNASLLRFHFSSENRLLAQSVALSFAEFFAAILHSQFAYIAIHGLL